MLYKHLCRLNPSYDAATWEDYELLYKGGDDLLRNRETMRRVFPMHGNEEAGVYAERIERANYIPYAGAILDYLVASVFAEPIAITAEPKAPAFFDEFHESVDGYHLDLTSLLRQQLLTGLIKRCAWTLVDLPPRDDGAVIESEAAEEDVGLLRAFAFPIDPECVLDYDCGPSGDLEWAIIRTRSRARKSLADDRKAITDRFTWYDRNSWERWDITYSEDRPPKPNQDIPTSASGAHSFGRVPLIRLEVPDGMWAMAKLAPIARQHLNKRSATDWSMYRQLFPILSAHLAPELPGGATPAIPAEAATDPSRATAQIYGVGRMVIMQKDDEFRYTSPDSKIYDAALKDLDGLRDELHRVVHQMALAANNSAAALGRSGESKSQDKAAAAVVLAALGELARRHAVEVFRTAAAGRRDPPMSWTAHGAQDFDVEDLSSAVEEATAIQALDIPSATFHQIYRFSIAKKAIRGLATPEQLEEIREEIEAATTEESLKPQPPQMQPNEKPDGDEGSNRPAPSDDGGDKEAA